MQVKEKGKIDIEEDYDKKLKLLIGKRIQKVRKRLDHTARWVAEKMGVDRATISQIETGRNHINSVTLYKLASLLKCKVQDFFPEVPESASLTETDISIVAQENAKAAEFLKKAFKPKNDKRN